jgi:lipoate-protein ligase B
LLPHLKENSQFGSEDQSFHHFPPSKPCGLAEPNTTKLVQVSSTENVSELISLLLQKKKPF